MAKRKSLKRGGQENIHSAVYQNGLTMLGFEPADPTTMTINYRNGLGRVTSRKGACISEACDAINDRLTV